jgi:hypothetical protein
MAGKHPLRALNVSKIDIEEARNHFDLPIEDQFSSKAQLNQGLKATKDQLLHMLGQDELVTVYRGMTVPSGFVDELEAGIPVGMCWAWDRDGALKGSRLDRGEASDGEVGIILVATTDPENVNWEFTVAVNTFHEDEKEIVMIDDSDLILQKVLLVQDGRVVRDLLSDGQRGLEITSGEPVERGRKLHL